MGIVIKCPSIRSNIIRIIIFILLQFGLQMQRYKIKVILSIERRYNLVGWRYPNIITLS